MKNVLVKQFAGILVAAALGSVVTAGTATAATAASQIKACNHTKFSWTFVIGGYNQHNVWELSDQYRVDPNSCTRVPNWWWSSATVQFNRGRAEARAHMQGSSDPWVTVYVT